MAMLPDAMRDDLLAQIMERVDTLRIPYTKREAENAMEDALLCGLSPETPLDFVVAGVLEDHGLYEGGDVVALRV